MAQSYVGSDGTQVVPGATASFSVKSSAGGIATSGVLMLVGEADAGPDWSLETIANLKTGFGPNSEQAVVAKYQSGPLVEAYRAASQPLADNDITGAPSKLILIKSNPSGKASAQLLNWDSSNYAQIFDKSYGLLGNLISRNITAQVAEAVPTTGPFTWIPAVGTVALAFRVNGAAHVTLTTTADETPAAVQAAIDGLSGVACSGGALVTTAQDSTGTLAVAASGNNVVVTYSGTFTNTPAVGSTMVIPAGSVIEGASNVNVGAYVVTGATNNSISATKLSDGNKGGAVIGTITAPANVSAQAVSASAVADLANYAALTISVEAANPSPGLGKSLEICQLTTGTDLLSRAAFALSATPVSWISKSGTPNLLTSATEYQANLALARQLDNVSENLIAGGDVVLQVSYTGTSATLTVNDTTLTTAVTGGAGGGLTLNLKQFPTVADLAAYINAQTGYKAQAGTAALGQMTSQSLDDGTYGICTEFGALNGRIKSDAFKFFNVIAGSSVLVQMGNPPAQAAAGLPGPTASVAFLGGGSRGGTSGAQFQAAVDVLKKISGNFLVPCFSRDASADIADGLTEAGQTVPFTVAASTYTIDAIHAICRSHVLAMSKRLAKKPRQTFLSIKDTYANDKLKAANMAQARCSMSFLDQKVVDVNGNVTQFAPYIDAAIAAGGQAAGFYKALVKKQKNVSGSLQAAGDWDSSDNDQLADALLSGLLPTTNRDDGGFEFTSDQTTFLAGPNFVWNSIQAIYVSDVISQSTRVAFEDRYVGKSQADVSASEALTFLEATMAEFMRLKLIAPSDDAPLGFRKASITISGPTMLVNAEVKVAGAIYFIPISFVMSMVQQSASQG